MSIRGFLNNYIFAPIAAFLSGKSKNPQDLLKFSIEYDSLYLFKRSINQGADINSHLINSHLDDETPLMKAIRLKRTDLVNSLVSLNANVYAKNSQKETALHYALKYNDLEIAQLLIINKADINATATAGRTPLHISIENSNLEAIKLLLENNADIEKAFYTSLSNNRERLTPVELAAKIFIQGNQNTQKNKKPNINILIYLFDKAQEKKLDLTSVYPVLAEALLSMKEPSTSRLKTDLPWWATLLSKIFYSKEYAKAVKKAAEPKVLSSTEAIIYFVNKGLPPLTLFKAAIDNKSDKYPFIIKQFMNQDNIKSFYDSMLTTYAYDNYHPFQSSPFTLSQEDFNSLIKFLFFNSEEQAFLKINIIGDLFNRGLKLDDVQLKNVLTADFNLNNNSSPAMRSKYELLVKQYEKQILAEKDFYLKHAIHSQNKTLLESILKIPEISKDEAFINDIILKIIDSSNKNLLDILNPYKDRLQTFTPSVIERVLNFDKLNPDFFANLSMFYSINMVDKELSILSIAIEKLMTHVSPKNQDDIARIFYYLIKSINSTLGVYDSNLREEKCNKFKQVIKSQSFPLSTEDKSKVEMKFKEIFKELYDKAAETKPAPTPKNLF